MAAVVYTLSCRNSQSDPPGLRKTGLAPTWVFLQRLSDGAGVTQPAITEIGQGAYKFSFDAESLGDAAGQVDFGATLTAPADRYVDVLLTREPSRILTNVDTTVSSRLAAADYVPGDGGGNGGGGNGAGAGQSLTDEEYQDAITAGLGQTGNAAFAAYLDLIWPVYGAFPPYLQYLFAYQESLRYLIGQASGKVDWKEADVSESASQEAKAWLSLYQTIGSQILSYQALLRGSRPPAVGEITRVTPITARDPYPVYPEPSAREYRGDPLRRTVRRR